MSEAFDVLAAHSAASVEHQLGPLGHKIEIECGMRLEQYGQVSFGQFGWKVVDEFDLITVDIEIDRNLSRPR